MHGTGWTNWDFKGHIALIMLTLGIIAASGALAVFGKERLVHWRERESGVRVFSYFMANSTTNMVDVFIQPLVFLSVYYSMTIPSISFGLVRRWSCVCVCWGWWRAGAGGACAHTSMACTSPRLLSLRLHPCSSIVAVYHRRAGGVLVRVPGLPHVHHHGEQQRPGCLGRHPDGHRGVSRRVCVLGRGGVDLGRGPGSAISVSGTLPALPRMAGQTQRLAWPSPPGMHGQGSRSCSGSCLLPAPPTPAGSSTGSIPCTEASPHC